MLTDARWQCALDALTGLSVGDALGDRFNERTAAVAGALLRKGTPPPPWRYTDDTLMACSIAAVLRARGVVDPDWLARSFVDGYAPDRGYGPLMRDLLEGGAASGVRVAAANAFGGRGSFGNGAVMRVAPLGAWFADDVARAACEGVASAVVTHTHPEASAGASAIAVAAARFASARGATLDRAMVFEAVLDHVPVSDVRVGLERARVIDTREDPLRVAKTLGADRDIACQVTVPFTLWMATRAPDDFAGTLFATYAVGGDRDTHGAIIGGLLAARLGRDAIPSAWRDATEPLPSWL